MENAYLSLLLLLPVVHSLKPLHNLPLYNSEPQCFM